MTEKLSPDALIEAALLTQVEPLNEKAMRELCVPPLSPDKLIDVLAQLKARWQGRALQLVHTHEAGASKSPKPPLNDWAACKSSARRVIPAP